MQTHDLLTRAEAAERARVSSATLSRYVANGRGPTVTRIGRKVLFRADHLNAWLDRFAGPNADQHAA